MPSRIAKDLPSQLGLIDGLMRLNESRQRQTIGWKGILFKILSGQFLSFLLGLVAISSQKLAESYDFNIPTTQTLPAYLLLFITFFISLARTSDWNFRDIFEKYRQRFKYLIILAIIDVEANFLVVKAYQYTDLTSITLLNCFSIPCIMLFSKFLLNVTYRPRHYLGVLISLAGLAILVYSDFDDGLNDDDENNSSDPLLGDLLCLVAATLYAVGIVGQELYLAKYNETDYVAVFAFFGLIISASQTILIERKEIAKTDWNLSSGLLFVCYSGSMYLFYSLFPFVLRRVGATFIDISLLSSDAFAILAGVFIFHYELSSFYFIAFFLTIVGVVVYNLAHTSEYAPFENENDQIQQHQQTNQVISIFPETPPSQRDLGQIENYQNRLNIHLGLNIPNDYDYSEFQSDQQQQQQQQQEKIRQEINNNQRYVSIRNFNEVVPSQTIPIICSSNESTNSPINSDSFDESNEKYIPVSSSLPPPSYLRDLMYQPHEIVLSASSEITNPLLNNNNNNNDDGQATKRNNFSN